MLDKKSSKSKAKRVRVIFGREKSEDELVKAIGKMCKEAGIEFISSPKKRNRKIKKGKM